jgi:hypothetical protein
MTSPTEAEEAARRIAETGATMMSSIFRFASRVWSSIWPSRRSRVPETDRVSTAETAPSSETRSVVVAFSVENKTRHRNQKTNHEKTSFYYLDNLLSEIPTARRIMRKFRQLDDDAYRYHAKVGVRLVANGIAPDDDAYRRFVRLLPSAAMVYFPPVEGEKVSMCVYFCRVTRASPHIAVPMGSRAVYRVTLVYTPTSKGRAVGYSYLVAVKDSSIQAIPERSVSHCILPRGGSFSRVTWGMSHGLEIHWRFMTSEKEKDSEKEKEAKKTWGSTPAEFGAFLFYITTGYVETDKEFHVRAERDNISVSFGVALKRTPYFFKNRDKVVNERGKTRPIFHAVEGHTRVLPSGKESSVKPHYRGLRRFTWAGESVTITQPEHSVLEWNLSAIESDDDTVGEGMMPMGDMGSFVIDATENKIKANG